tara:strand:+ start:2833 stop:3786 length:954 start_codon:yes stop_codon:yes gene_type:complete
VGTLLRYPGGKARALKKIIKYFPEDLTEMVSPFFGGGAIEIHYAQKHKTRVHGYDLFPQLVQFWEMTLLDPERLAEEVTVLKNANPDLTEIWTQAQDTLRNTEVTQDNAFALAALFYGINRSSFSGTTLSGGCSNEAYHKRFTPSSIDRLRNFKAPTLTVECADFEDSLSKHDPDVFVYADPPYLLENSSLYGDRGNTHKDFDHQKLFEVMRQRNNWVMSYNPHPDIISLYESEGYKIEYPEWSMGMKNIYTVGQVKQRTDIKNLRDSVAALSSAPLLEDFQGALEKMESLLASELKSLTKDMGKAGEILILNVKGD